MNDFKSHLQTHCKRLISSSDLSKVGHGPARLHIDSRGIVIALASDEEMKSIREQMQALRQDNHMLVRLKQEQDVSENGGTTSMRT